jgi:short-subunit dehydrogenase
MKYELPLLKFNGGGAIVNVASNGGLSAIPHAPAYVARQARYVSLLSSTLAPTRPRGGRLRRFALRVEGH